MFNNHQKFLIDMYPKQFEFKRNENKVKIASFDMDWTLIKTKGG